MPDTPEKPEDKEVEVRDIDPEKDPKGGRRRRDPCDGGE